MDSGIHRYCSEGSTHNFCGKTGSKMASPKLLVLFFLLSIADNRQQKGFSFSMIETNSQNSVWLINNPPGSSLAFSLQPVGSSSSSPALLQHLSPLLQPVQ